MDDDLEAILSSDKDILPSTQFVSNVMAAVHREASTPAPISFPWWRVLPGAAICVVALSVLMAVAIHQLSAAPQGSAPTSMVLGKVFALANRVELGWIALALFVSLVPAKLARARM
jgi:hypothetical protein